MQLSDARKQQGLRQTDVVIDLWRRGYRWMNQPALSKIEQCKLLPTPPLAEDLSKICNFPVSQFYGPHGLKIANIYGDRSRARQTPETVYKPTACVPMDIIGSREKLHEVLRRNGYKSYNDFAIKKIKQLYRLDARKQKSAPASVAAETDALKEVIHISCQVYHAEGGCQDVPDMPPHTV